MFKGFLVVNASLWVSWRVAVMPLVTQNGIIWFLRILVVWNFKMKGMSLFGIGLECS